MSEKFNMNVNDEYFIVSYAMCFNKYYIEIVFRFSHSISMSILTRLRYTLPCARSELKKLSVHVLSYKYKWAKFTTEHQLGWKCHINGVSVH